MDALRQRGEEGRDPELFVHEIRCHVGVEWKDTGFVGAHDSGEELDEQ